MFAKLGAVDITVIILVAIILLLILYIVITVNSFKRLLVQIGKAGNEVDQYLTQRYELLTKALNIAKDHTGQKDTSVDAIELKKDMTIDEKALVYKQLKEVNIKVNSLINNKEYAGLVQELKDSEEDLQSAIKNYNSIVAHFNQMLVSFPAKTIARMINLKPIKPFDFS